MKKIKKMNCCKCGCDTVHDNNHGCNHLFHAFVSLPFFSGFLWIFVWLICYSLEKANWICSQCGTNNLPA
jgi:hypothetical protein